MAENDSKSYGKITDTIYAVLLGLSFRHHFYLLLPPDITFKVIMLLFAYIVIIFSRLLYEKSIINKPYKGPMRFIWDLWILYMYFVMVFSIGGENESPNYIRFFSSIVGIYFGYCIWDIFKRDEYPDTKVSRTIITFGCLLLSVVILILYNQPILLYEDVFLGSSVRNGLFLSGVFVLFLIFWKIKWPDN